MILPILGQYLRRKPPTCEYLGISRVIRVIRVVIRVIIRVIRVIRVIQGQYPHRNPPMDSTWTSVGLLGSLGL